MGPSTRASKLEVPRISNQRPGDHVLRQLDTLRLTDAPRRRRPGPSPTAACASTSRPVAQRCRPRSRSQRTPFETLAVAAVDRHPWRITGLIGRGGTGAVYAGFPDARG
jgi:hypothetical protein